MFFHSSYYWSHKIHVKIHDKNDRAKNRSMKSFQTDFFLSKFRKCFGY